MMSSRRFGALTLIPAAALVAVLAGATAIATAPPHADAHGAAATRASFHDAMRMLWEDHIVWTRQFIVSAATEAENLPDTGPTVDRLLANQADIGDAIKPFYGEAAGDSLRYHLRVNILTGTHIIEDAKADA